MRTTLCTTFLIAATVTLPTLRALDAQSRPSEPPRPREPGEVRIERLPGGMAVFMGGGNRAVLGVTLASDDASSADGVRIDDVRTDGPAAKAGLKAGDVITEINGVSLRLSAVDAADPALAGTAHRRLQRTLAKAKPGDDVTLRVASGGSTRSATVRSVSAAELEGVRERRMGQDGWATGGDRPAIGLTLGASGSVRDTLGLFISSVVAKGPAELAGIVEGERVAAVNGVDVRVPREDADDWGWAEARVNRFIREVQKGEAGATVTLRVYGGGRYREVAVKSVRQSDLPSSGFNIRIGDGLDQMRMLAPMPQSFQFEGGNGRIRIFGDGDGGSILIEREAIERAMDGIRRGLQEMGRELRVRIRDGNGGVMFTSPRPPASIRRTITVL